MTTQKLSEKYRPTLLDDIIGQDHIVRKIKNLLDTGFFIDCFFIGNPGVGKTTMAKCIDEEFESRYWREKGLGGFKMGPSKSTFKFFHGRTVNQRRMMDKIREVTKHKGRGVIFIDEADGLSEKSQQELRPLLERKKSRTFILASNIDLEGLPSRLERFHFKPIHHDDIYKRLVQIAKVEGLILPVAPVVLKQFFITLSRWADGDLRKAINRMQPFIKLAESGHKQFDIELIQNELMPRD